MPSYQLRLNLVLKMKLLLIKRQPVLRQSKPPVSPSLTERAQVADAQSSLFCWLPDSPRAASDSPGHSSQNNRSSHCSTAHQEPSAHCPLRCPRRKGHCPFSSLQSHFSDGAVLPWPQRTPAAIAAATLRSKTENHSWRLCYQHCASS